MEVETVDLAIPTWDVKDEDEHQLGRPRHHCDLAAVGVNTSSFNFLMHVQSNGTNDERLCARFDES